VPIGGVVHVSGGNLAAKYVIEAVGPKYDIKTKNKDESSHLLL